VIAPRRNEPDLEDMPQHLVGDLDFIWASEIDEVLDAALEQSRNGSRDGALRRRPVAIAQ
jgi:ATP-dependent Lon protease